MFTRFDTNKSTKGASKLRRDLINAEIANLRDLLPLPPSTRQRLSQLQLMALICVYVRKANYFQQMFKRFDISHQAPTPNIGFSKALSGFLMMMTQNGKLLYISDNAAEYLGHSMEDLLIHGDSVYDIIDKQDHQGVQTELCRTPADGEDRLFLCRMNVSRNARRQMRFGDQKVVLIKGHFLSFLPLCSRNEPVFLAACAPIAMPETRECVVQGATNVFTTIHSMDMKIMHVDKNGEWHLGWEKSDLQGISWYQLLHWESMREAQSKHRLITQSEQDRSCIMLVRLQRKDGDWLYLHSVLQVKDNMENTQQPVIVCTNQVLSDQEAAIMRANPWLYHYYSAQSKLQYGLNYEASSRTFGQPPPAEPPPVGGILTAPPPGTVPFLNGNRANLAPPPPPPHLIHMTFPYERMEAGPVDYSVHTVDERYQLPVEDVRVSPLHHHPKRKARSPNSKLHQLASNSPCPSPAIVDTGGGTLMSLTHSTSSRRSVTKANADPTEFMEQWNPSPPWSETTLQKVPDLTHQELSPYVTTTPPTPSRTPSGIYSNGQTHPTFSFDWSPEQYVPHGQYTNMSGMVEETHSTNTAWPEHRLFPLQPPPPPRLVHSLQVAERMDDNLGSDMLKATEDANASAT